MNKIHLCSNNPENKNQKVKKNPHHLNKLECCFFEYLYTYIRENDVQDGAVSISLDDFIQTMHYQSGSDNNVRKAVTSLAEHSFGESAEESWPLYSIKNLTAKDRKMELVLSKQFINMNRPHCSMRLLPYYLLLDKYYSRVLLLYLLNSKPDREMERIERENDDVYRFTVGRNEESGRVSNLYEILCGDLTHCAEIPSIWEQNFGYFAKTVLEPIIEEFQTRAQINLRYDISKVDLSGKRHRQNKQIALYVQGHDNWLLANLSNPFQKTVNEKVEHREDEDLIEGQVEYAAQKDEVTVTSPENIAAIYPKVYDYLVGYNIDPQDAVQIIQGAESHMNKESFNKRERWVERYLEFYLNILCPNGRVEKVEDLKYHIKYDSKRHAVIINNLIRML